MSRLHISTRGIGSWRDRLADPVTHWKRGCSAFETAVSWEDAASRASGLPEKVERAFVAGGLVTPTLMFAVAEHQVALRGRGRQSQCDVWALVRTGSGIVSLAVEAKAREPFGRETLSQWLEAGSTSSSKANRRVRWDHIRENLPEESEEDYGPVAYQLLHRCGAAVIVQAFGAESDQYIQFEQFCSCVGITPHSGALDEVRVGEIRLSVGWVDCPLATDPQVAATA